MLPSVEPSGSKAPAVNRAISILRVLGRASAPLGVNAIARELDLVPSTCLHILRALEAEGLVHVSPLDHRYSQDAKLVVLARAALNRMAGVQEADKILRSMAEQFNASFGLLHIGHSGRSVVLAAAHHPTAYGLVIEVGRRFPVFAGASGRCVAAYANLSRDQYAKVFSSLTWARPLSLDQWLRQVANVPTKGVGVDIGHYLRGFTNIAAPILQDGKVWRTIIAISAQGQLEPQEVSMLENKLAECGKEFGRPLK